MAHEPPILRFGRRSSIQLGVAALALGAAGGSYLPSFAVICALGLTVLGCIRWTRGWLLAVLLATGAVRGLLHEHRQPPRSDQVPIAALASTRAWLEQGINRALPVPEAPLLSGLLLGARSELPADLREDFRRTGTSHIVAVSGFNVSIVIGAVVAILTRLPLPFRFRMLTALIGVAAFVVMTGASASVVRAGIMGSLAVVARATGRLSDGVHLLVLTGGAMLLIQPAFLFDVGFQLSVAATYGLLAFAEPIESRLKRIPEAAGVRAAMASTLAATLTTLPLILIVFGRVSVVTLLANVLVLPLIPVAMAAGFGVALMTAGLPVLGPVTGWVAWLPLMVIVRVVTTLSAWPFASVQLSVVWSGALAVAAAGLIGWLMVSWRQRAVR